MQQGTQMPIAYYDVHAAHLPRHRQLQDQAMFTQDMQLWQTVENHCQLHINAAQAQAAQQIQSLQAAAPNTPGTPQAPAPGTPSKPPGL
jgi:hypothetical protein